MKKQDGLNNDLFLAVTIPLPDLKKIRGLLERGARVVVFDNDAVKKLMPSDPDRRKKFIMWRKAPGAERFQTDALFHAYAKENLPLVHLLFEYCNEYRQVPKGAIEHIRSCGKKEYIDAINFLMFSRQKLDTLKFPNEANNPDITILNDLIEYVFMQAVNMRKSAGTLTVGKEEKSRAIVRQLTRLKAHYEQEGKRLPTLKEFCECKPKPFDLGLTAQSLDEILRKPRYAGFFVNKARSLGDKNKYVKDLLEKNQLTDKPRHLGHQDNEQVVVGIALEAVK